MKKTTLALCFAGYEPESESKIINEIIQQCKLNNINLLVFCSVMLKGDFPKGIDKNSNLVRGESEIYKLIDFRILDGLFVFGNSIYKSETVLDLEKHCKNQNIPIININDPTHKFANNVAIENSFAMELIIEHLITVHKLTKINFIGGYEDNKESNERLAAYKRILTKYGLPIEPERIGYGHFWKASVDCAKQFLKYDMPQAIVCANDTMAIFVCDYLKNQGFRIPEDIIVTGFDGTTDANIYEPNLTTVRPDFISAGNEAFALMMKLVRGEETEPDVSVDYELVVQESCGCHKEFHHEHNYIDSKYLNQNMMNNFYKDMVKSNIYFSDDDTPKSLIEHLSTPLENFGFKKFFYCIDSKLENKEDYFYSVRNKNSGMPSKVMGLVPYNVDFSNKPVFNSKDLLWYDFLDAEETVIYFFTALYFRNHCLGYVVYEPEYNSKVIADLFQIWVSDASEKIGSFYLKRELEKLNEKDHLTGLYNRRGMEKNFEQAFKQIVQNNEFITIICVDIDYLKVINDKYGHEGGDNAIIQTAKAIKHVFSRNSVCVRTGGDEFCILTHSQKKVNIEKNIDKLDKVLEDYNTTSNLDYQVRCSCGYFTLCAKDFSSFEEMQKIADKNLYEIKEQHHSRS